MRITRIKTFLAGSNLLLVRVYTDAGLIGNGESGLWAHQRPVAAAIADFSDYFVGKDPLRIEHHRQVVARQSHFGGAVLSAALSAIDIALWDIFGKAVELPVYQLLGGKCRDRARLYCPVWGDSLEAVAEAARTGVDAGFTSLRLGPFFPDFEKQEGSQTVTAAVDMVAAVRDAVGHGIDLGVEIHRNLRPDEAIMLANALGPFRLQYIEDPIVPESVEALEYIARHIDIPLALGERTYELHEFKELVDLGIASFIRPDLSLAGGFTQVKKIAAIAEPALVQVFPHLMGSPVNAAAFTHLAAAIPNYAMMEPQRHSAEVAALVDGPFAERDGYREIPDRPGIGVEIDEAACERLPFEGVPITGFFHADGSVAH